MCRFILALSSFLFLTSVNAQTVTLKQIGKENQFFNIMAFEHFGGKLFTVNYKVGLDKTDLATGETEKLGNVTYKNGKFIFGMNFKLYMIETDGSMDEIDPVSGEWKTSSTMGVWSRTERVEVVRNSLYTIENGALFFHHGPNYNGKEQRGGSDFYNVGLLLRGETSLFSLQSDGTLYEINLTSGEWKKIGKNKTWKNWKAAAELGGKFYSVDNQGAFTVASLSDGEKKLLDEKQFANARYLFAESGKLYLITREGNLYEVQITGG